MEPYVAMIAAGLAFLAAAYFIGVAIGDFVRGARMYRWRRAEDRVVRSLVAHSAETEGEGALRSGSVVSATDRGSPSRKQAERRYARYTEGARVTVFYDPAHPDRAVLERGVGSGPPAMFAWGVLFLAGGLYIVRVLCGLGGALPVFVVRFCGAG
jgi:hypothetical protein